MTENDFLAKYLFHGINNRNNGIDVATIWHYSYSDLEKVMDRAERHGITILGIEFWSGTEMLDVLFREDYKNEPDWHRVAIASLDPKLLHQYLFVLTFHVPDEMLLALHAG